MPADHQCETGGDKREAIGKGEDKAAENRMRRNLSKLIKSQKLSRLNLLKLEKILEV